MYENQHVRRSPAFSGRRGKSAHLQPDLKLKITREPLLHVQKHKSTLLCVCLHSVRTTEELRNQLLAASASKLCRHRFLCPRYRAPLPHGLRALGKPAFWSAWLLHGILLHRLSPEISFPFYWLSRFWFLRGGKY